MVEAVAAARTNRARTLPRSRLRFFRLPIAALVLLAIGVGFGLGALDLDAQPASTDDSTDATTPPSGQPDEGEEGRPGDPLGAGSDLPSAHDAPVLLRYRFPADRERVYRISETTRERTTTGGGRTIDQARTTRLTIRETVVEGLQADQGAAAADDDEATGLLRLTIERIEFEQTSSIAPGVEIRFDSDRPEDIDTARAQPSLRPYAALAGHSFTVRLTPRGRVRSVSGFDDWLAEMFEGYTAPAFVAIRLALAAQFSDAAMAERFDQTFPIVPEVAQAPGGRWARTAEQEVPYVGTLHVAMAHTLQRVEVDEATDQQVASVGFSATITAFEDEEGEGDNDSEAGPAEIVPGFSMEGALQSGSLTGSYAFDVEGGYVARATFTQQINLTVTAVAAANDLGGQARLDATSELTSTLTIEPVVPDDDNTSDAGSEAN